MYDVYLDGNLLPVTPSEIKMKIKGKNETVSLLSGQDINILNSAGLTEVEFEALLPATRSGSFINSPRSIQSILGKLERLKIGKKSFQFIVSRARPNGNRLYNTNLKVALESYDVTESYKNVNDAIVKIKLKQAPDYSTKIVTIPKQKKAKVSQKRETEKAPNNTSYTVVSGDSLWKIAKKMYGDGTQWTKLYEANKSTIGANPNLIFPNQVLTIPRGA